MKINKLVPEAGGSAEREPEKQVFAGASRMPGQDTHTHTHTAKYAYSGSFDDTI